ncbi:MAG: type IX secretion system sortase PorU [Bacteroidetes bacterium]|nr:type IX secretion system sortase PorU [Bacteroidota bacterium]
MNTRYFSLTTVLSFIVCLMLSVPVSAQEVNVLVANERELVVEYRPTFRLIDLGTHGRVYDFDRAVQGAAQAGAPDLRTRVELIAFPALEGYELTVERVDYREEGNVSIAPVPGWQNGMEVYEQGEIYSIDNSIPVDIARITNLGISRDRILGELVLSPVQWNPATGVVRLYTRIVCRISFEESRDDLGVSALEGLHTAVLNPVEASLWALPRQKSLGKSLNTTLASGTWARIDVQQHGVYRLTRSWFSEAGFDVASIDPRTIRMFGNGGRERPQRLSDPRPDPLQEIAIEVVGGEDGRFDEGDYVQFYGQGLNGFSWNAVTRSYEHYFHRYAEVNAYFLTWGGEPGVRAERMASLNEADAFEPSWFPSGEFVEEEVLNLMSSGKMWVGRRLVPSAGSASSIVFTRRLPGLVRSQPVMYRMQTVSSAEVENSFSVRANDAILGTIMMGTVTFGSDTGDMAKLSGPRNFTGSGDLIDDRSTVTITYNSVNPDRTRDGYVDWIEWLYARHFQAENDALLFSAPDTTAVIEFVLNGFSMSDVVIYDITDYHRIQRMDAQISGGTVRFQVANEQGNPRQFIAVAAPAVKTPSAPAVVPNSDLLASSGAEYLIITHRDLLDAAQRLKMHRERPGEDHLSSMIIPLETIYNEFNCGIQDPTAIRDFLAWAMSHWSIMPRYVLFFGSGHYDYRNHNTDEKIMVPVWETENSINRIGSYVSDDYYAKVVGDDPRVDLATGRLPVQTIDEANTLVDKIIAYESDPSFGPWKNRVTFVADDGWTGYADTDRDQHTRQSERLANTVPGELEQKKIYIVSYRTEQTAQGRRKPEANAAIIDQINEGTLVINYTGHGAHDVWAHERVLLSDVTVPQLQNTDRLTFVAAATCTFGLYDVPGLRSGTELLLLRRNGGAIGGLSAPRVVFSGENSAFNLEFFHHLLREGREEDGRARRLGDAIYASKQRHNGIPGYEKFHLFADPGLRLALPRHTAALERILLNDQPVDSDTVQLSAFSKVTLLGSVRKGDGDPWADFSGTAEVSLFDAQRTLLVPEWGEYSYTMPGGLLYRGQARIEDGRFSLSFIVPKDISYENSPGRVAIYFDNLETDGAGYYLDLRLGGSDTTVVPDGDGPVIQLFLDDRTFQAGGKVGANPLLIADLFDVSGINTTGIGIGHDIEAWLDDGERGIVLNDYFTGDLDSYQNGTVAFRLRNLKEGPHTLRLRAWDVFNNSSAVETHFVVAEQLTLFDVRNYPNPVSGQTTFQFRHNVLEPVEVEIHLYASNGAMVRSMRSGPLDSHIIEIPWDGRDTDGNVPAQGVYLYRIICRTIDGAQGSEAVGRMMILN